MSAIFVAIHIACLVSFFFPILVAYGHWKKSQAPLGLNFLRMNLSLMVFLCFLFFGYVLLDLFPQNIVEIELFQHSVFFLLYSLMFIFVSRFLFELQQLPWNNKRRIITYALALAGPILLFISHSLFVGAQERWAALQLLLNRIYVPVFLSWFLYLFGSALVRRNKVRDPWKKSTILGAGLCFLFGTPLFLFDTFWQYFPVSWKLDHRGLAIHILVYFAWNIYFTFRWLAFNPSRKNSAENLPQLGEWNVDKMRNFTPREEQIVVSILAGKTNVEIAKEFEITVGTAKLHVYNIFNKIGASSRKELRDLLTRHG